MSIEIALDRVLLEDGTSVFDLALTGPYATKFVSSRVKGMTMRARMDRDALIKLKYHIEGLLLDTVPQEEQCRTIHESHRLNPNTAEYICLDCGKDEELDQPCKGKCK